MTPERPVCTVIVAEATTTLSVEASATIVYVAKSSSWITLQAWSSHLTDLAIDFHQKPLEPVGSNTMSSQEATTEGAINTDVDTIKATGANTGSVVALMCIVQILLSEI